MKRAIRLTALSFVLLGVTCGVHAAQHTYSPLKSIEQSWITASVQRGDSPLDALVKASFIGFTPDGASRPQPGLLIVASGDARAAPLQKEQEEPAVRLAGVGK